MIAAAGQLLRNAYLRYAGDGYVWMSREAAWLAPLGFLVLFLSIALVLSLLSWFAPFLTRRSVIGVFAFLSAWSILLHFSRLHPLAAIAIAAGLAIRVSTFVERASRTRLAALEVAAGTLAGLFVFIGVGERTWRGLGERRQVAALAEVDRSAPNVILIVLDTVRASSMSLYGAESPTTPFLSKLAGESTVYARAFAPSSWTLPSHVSLFTGIRPARFNATFESRLPPHSNLSLAERFVQRGYVTGAFTANFFYASYESGLMNGFIRLDDYERTLEEATWHANLTQLPLAWDLRQARSVQRLWAAFREPDLRVPPKPRHDPRRAEHVIDAFLTWRGARPEGRPYFAFLNLFDAHGEVEPPMPFARQFVRGKDGDRHYLGSIAYMDSQLERLVAALRASGEFDRTVFVITSDHGQQFGEHSLRQHGNSLYAQLLRVPLLIRHPSTLPAGLRVDVPVSLTDVPRTVSVLTGDRETPMPGHLLPPLQPATLDAHPPVISETNMTKKWGVRSDAGDIVSVVAGRFHYMRWGDGGEELYDHQADPEEVRDLSATAEGLLEIQRMRGRYQEYTTSR